MGLFAFRFFAHHCFCCSWRCAHGARSVNPFSLLFLFIRMNNGVLCEWACIRMVGTSAGFSSIIQRTWTHTMGRNSVVPHLTMLIKIVFYSLPHCFGTTTKAVLSTKYGLMSTQLCWTLFSRWRNTRCRWTIALRSWFEWLLHSFWHIYAPASQRTCNSLITYLTRDWPGGERKLCYKFEF